MLRPSRSMHPSRSIPVLLLAVALAFTSCDCGGPKTDEDKLRERVDTTSVHLYVAMKVAITKSGDDPRIDDARERLLRAIAAAQRLVERGADEEPQGQPTATEPAKVAAEVLGTGRDAISLATALFELRALGRDIVRERREDELDPVLPILLRELDPNDPLAAQVDANTEHGILLLAFWVLKSHEQSPVPIPTEIVLYEAWMTDAGSLGISGLEPLVRAIKAHAYATNELCDLAGAESDALAAGDPETRRTGLAGAFATFGGPPMSAEELAALDAASRALAHGSTGICYLDREQEPEARREIARFVDAAEELGVAPEETALVRAWLAWKDGDAEGARRYLELAKQREGITARERAQIDEVIAYARDGDADSMNGFYYRAFFAAFTVRVVLDRLEEAGVLGKLADTQLFRATYGFVVSVGQVIRTARDAVPSFSDVAEQGRGCLQGLVD